LHLDAAASEDSSADTKLCEIDVNAEAARRNGRFRSEQSWREGFQELYQQGMSQTVKSSNRAAKTGVRNDVVHLAIIPFGFSEEYASASII
jgi:hypothetical protein